MRIRHTGGPARLSPPEEWVLRTCLESPYSSLPDLVGRGANTRREVERAIPLLQSKGYLAGMKMGNTMPAVERYWVPELGHRYWRHWFEDDDIPWASYADGLEMLLERFPSVEQTYRCLSAIIGEGGANGVLRFRWLRGASIHAVAELDGGRWVMFIWAGIWADPKTVADKWRYRFRELDHYSPAAIHDERTGVSDVDHTVRPSAVVVVAIDDWAAQVVVNELLPRLGSLALRVFTPDALLSRETVLLPSPDKLIEPPRRSNRRPKLPSATPSLMPISDKPTFTVFTTIEQWAGIRVSQIADMLGDWTGNVTPIVERLSGKEPSKQGRRSRSQSKAGVDPGEKKPPPMVLGFDGRHCLSFDGLKQAARRDRISPQKTLARFGHFLSDDGKSRDHYWLHDGRVASIAARMKRAGLPVAAGWRAIYNVPGVTQIAPDFVVRFGAASVGGFTLCPGWYYGEYERSAITLAAIADKLANRFRLADHLSRQGRLLPPIMFIVDHEDVERMYWEIGNGLPLFTATYDRVMQGPLVNDGSVFRNLGVPVTFHVPTVEQRISWPR